MGRARGAHRLADHGERLAVQGDRVARPDLQGLGESAFDDDAGRANPGTVSDEGPVDARQGLVPALREDRVGHLAHPEHRARQRKRTRSIRRRVAAEASTVWARACSRGTDPGRHGVGAEQEAPKPGLDRIVRALLGRGLGDIRRLADIVPGGGPPEYRRASRHGGLAGRKVRPVNGGLVAGGFATPTGRWVPAPPR
jgi:hypothetical protein